MVCLKGKETIPNNCENLADTRGPYKTENECEDRIFEIRANLSKYKPKFESKGYLCKEISYKQ